MSSFDTESNNGAEAASDAQMRELVQNMKWELLHKTKREITGLFIEAFIKLELATLQIQDLKTQLNSAQTAQKEQK